MTYLYFLDTPHSITFCHLYRLTLSYQAQVTLQLKVILSDLV